MIGKWGQEEWEARAAAEAETEGVHSEAAGRRPAEQIGVLKLMEKAADAIED